MIEHYQDEAAWLAARPNQINASESRILCEQGYAGESVLALWAAKTQDWQIEPDASISERLRVGRLIEPSLVTMFEDLTGLETYTERGYVRHIHENGLMAATLDGFCWEGDDRGVLELKNVDAWEKHDWADGPPLRVQIQIQQQMACAEADWGYAFALIGGNQRVSWRVERNDSFLVALTIRIGQFWYEYVLPGKMPPPDFSPAAEQVLRKLHPLDSGAVVALDDSTLIDQLEWAKAMRKEADKLEQTAKIQLMAAMGDATYGVAPDGRCASWKTQSANYKARPAETRETRILRLHRRVPEGMSVKWVQETVA